MTRHPRAISLRDNFSVGRTYSVYYILDFTCRRNSPTLPLAPVPSVSSDHRSTGTPISRKVYQVDAKIGLLNSILSPGSPAILHSAARQSFQQAPRYSTHLRPHRSMSAMSYFWQLVPWPTERPANFDHPKKWRTALSLNSLAITGPNLGGTSPTSNTARSCRPLCLRPIVLRPDILHDSAAGSRHRAINNHG